MLGEEKNYIGDYIKMILSPNKHSFYKKVPAGQNMNSLQYFKVK